VFEVMVHDLRVLLRQAAGRKEQPMATIFDGCTLQSSRESRERVMMTRSGAKAPRHIWGDPLERLLALPITSANEQDRAEVAALAQAVEAATGETVEIAFVDQGYMGDETVEAASERGLQLPVVKQPNTKYGFALLPRWSGWLNADLAGWGAFGYERLPDTLKGLHFLAFAILMAQCCVHCLVFCL
jgi:hypothetical protein